MKIINDDLVIMCDEILDTLENVSADYINKKQHLKWIIIFFTFSLVTILLLTILSY